MRTWILVALRAATEPVKEEAMQAIFVLGLLCGVQRTCAGEWRCRGSISAFVQEKIFSSAIMRRGGRFVCQVVHSNLGISDTGCHTKNSFSDAPEMEIRSRLWKCPLWHLPGIDPDQPMNARNGFPFAFQPESVVRAIVPGLRFGLDLQGCDFRD